ncbi:hypothetical protein J4526_01875 [Desulfurococcaceae archaeon MEX13E-LK6-19]|nr:hypothetical protein J4526_01875 [Desulfurococcaceae archaeon MEX13E-LK6-19]
MTRFARVIKQQLQATDNTSVSSASDLEYLLQTPSLYRTLLLIHEYLVVNKRRGFTYDGIKSYAASRRFYSEYTDRTLDRAIRKLAELGYLNRVHPRDNKKKVIFVPTEKFQRVIEERRGLLDDG